MIRGDKSPIAGLTTKSGHEPFYLRNVTYWFIGMEEGGGDTFENVNKRLSEWNKRGRQELEDVAEFHMAIGLGELFNESPKLQPTWNKLIRMLLSTKGQQDIQMEQVQEYQRTLLGKAPDGENCLIELLPLPSPSISDWIYTRHSGLAQLADRRTYKKHYIDIRAKHIQERINQIRQVKPSHSKVPSWLMDQNIPSEHPESLY
jgi:hypothetical protein